MEDYAVGLLKSMLEIYSPTGLEDRLARFLEGELRRLGFEAYRDLEGNVIARLGPSEPYVLLCSHMDTVRGRLPVRVVDGYITGRGAVDAKGPLASMIVAASLYAKRGGRLGVVVAAVVDEEGLSRGIKRVVEDLPKPICAFFGEPSNTYGVTVGYKGSLTARIEVRTETGHVASHSLYDNAAEVAYEAWLRVKEGALRRSSSSRFNSLDAVLTHISTARRPGVVPDRCTLHVNLRLPPSMRCEEAWRLVVDACSRTLKAHPRARVEASLVDCVEAFEAPPTSLAVRALQRAIIRVLGRRPMLLRKTGTGDVNVAARRWDVPMAVYGPGDSSLDHTPHERLSISDYLSSIRVYEAALWELEALLGGPRVG